jgi:hypothetical protein
MRSSKNYRRRFREKQQRQEPSYRAVFIVQDSKREDRKSGFANDLTVSWEHCTLTTFTEAP